MRLVTFKRINICRKTLVIFVLAMFAIASEAQDTVFVKGVVYDLSKKPLENISVSIAGSLEMPVVTNDKGEFSVISTSGNDWLIFSSLGDYKTKRVYLNNRSQLEIFLTPKALVSGDDQVNILSRAVPRRNINAAYSSVDAKDIIYNPGLTIDQYLQGRVAGLQATTRSGDAYSGTYMALRGINTLNATSQPLFVVDGIPIMPTEVFGALTNGYDFNPLMQLNTFDVSKITVIKDPAITAAYGSKASNGLVLIETLDPSVTQTTIEIDVRSGFSLSPSQDIPQLNAEEHKALMQEVLFTSGKLEEEIQYYYPGLFYTPADDQYINYQHNTNWQKEIFRNASMSHLNINVKGGDEIATYGLSFGYDLNNGIIKKTSYSGYNLRFVSRINVYQWLKMNAGVSINSSKNYLKDAAVSEQTSPIWTSLAKSPLLFPYQYDDEGNVISDLSEVEEFGVSNPLATIQSYEASNNNTNFIFAIGADAALTRKIELKTKFNFTYDIANEVVFYPNLGMESYYDGEVNNIAKSGNNEFKSFYNNTYLNYSKQLGPDQNLTSMTGINIQVNQFEFDWGMTKNASENDQYRNLQNGTDNLRELGGVNRNWNWFLLYENLAYTYKDKYLVNASISLDGSSRIGDHAKNTVVLGGQPFGLFYSAAVAWRLSSEPFLKNKAWLEDLKLRVSFGKSGNDDIGESSASNYYKAIRYRETVGIYPAVVSNDELTYENVNQLDGGVDVALFGNRFRATVDLYRSQTKNMLIYNPIEKYYGYEYRMENSGKMKNTGWELTLFGRVVDRKAFKWDVEGILSSFKNKVISIEGNKILTNIEGCDIVNMEGSPANSFYGYIFKGVYRSTEEANNANLYNATYKKYKAGDAIFEDLSGPQGTPDGIINDYDKTSIGSPLPKLIGSLNNALTYKRFTLNVMIQFVTGNDVFNYLRYKDERMTGLENQSANVLNRWQYEGQSTDVPRALWNDPVGNSNFSTRWIEDGSYLRLKNVSLSYKIPEKWFAFRYAEFYISANNLFTATKYLGYDPEFSYSYSPVQQGIDYGMTPTSRQFLAGLKIGL